MLVDREPLPALRPFVERLWFADGPRAQARERMLPTGRASLVLRLDGQPIRAFAGATDLRGESFGSAAVLGARSAWFERDTASPGPVIGVWFRPQGASALLEVPSIELAQRHTPLDALWGRRAEELRDRLAEERGAAARLAHIEQLLLARLERARGHPAVAQAVRRLTDPRATPRIDALRRELGLSHRRFVELFRREVGLTPKVFARIQRFNAACAAGATGAAVDWARLALDCGFYDQPHLNREFRAFAGVAPSGYRPVAVERPFHVLVRSSPTGSNPSKTRAAAAG